MRTRWDAGGPAAGKLAELGDLPVEWGAELVRAGDS